MDSKIVLLVSVVQAIANPMSTGFGNQSTRLVCSPRLGPCNWSNCYTNSTGSLVCPDCCGELVCKREMAGYECLERWPTFSEICQSVRRTLKKGASTDSALDEQFTLSYSGKNCAITIQGQQSFESACRATTVAIYGFRTAADGDYVLSNGTGTCSTIVVHWRVRSAWTKSDRKIWFILILDCCVELETTLGMRFRIACLHEFSYFHRYALWIFAYFCMKSWKNRRAFTVEMSFDENLVGLAYTV